MKLFQGNFLTPKLRRFVDLTRQKGISCYWIICGVCFFGGAQVHYQEELKSELKALLMPHKKSDCKEITCACAIIISKWLFNSPPRKVFHNIFHLMVATWSTWSLRLASFPPVDHIRGKEMNPDTEISQENLEKESQLVILYERHTFEFSLAIAPFNSFWWNLEMFVRKVYRPKSGSFFRAFLKITL